MIPSKALVNQKRLDLERKLAVLVEMAAWSPEDAELPDLIRVVQASLAANDSSPETTGQMILNTDCLIDYHIRKRSGPI